MRQASRAAAIEAAVPPRARLRAKAHGGRPTRAEATRRQRRFIEIAGVMFMRHGFAGTSIDAVAEAAGTSKRTVYAHYADKTALFGAVLRDLIERCLVPIRAFEGGSLALEPMLREIGRHLLAAALAPEAVSVHRIIIAESARQPEFGRLAHAEGRKPAVQAIASVLRRHRGELRVADVETAAQQFLSLVVDHSLCLASLGIREDRRGIEARVRAAVDLFLHGAAAHRSALVPRGAPAIDSPPRGRK